MAPTTRITCFTSLPRRVLPAGLYGARVCWVRAVEVVGSILRSGICVRGWTHHSCLMGIISLRR